MINRAKTLLLILAILGLSQTLRAGITGTLSGKVVDKETGQFLAGAQIVVEGTTMGTMADRNGHFMIYNLPAGRYDVSVSMIGYTRLTIKTVKINVDLNTELDFAMSAEVLPLDEIVVTDQRKLIQSEITSSTYFISGDDINQRLPIDTYLDAVALLPGVVGSHVRGSRETGVLYLLDGLPVQSGFSREISSFFPNNSVAEMMVQTGGFNAEYGHATSGVVNVISKNGRNKFDGNFRIHSDLFETGLAGNDNTRRLELNFGGPMTIGLGGPLINTKYHISADLNLSDTQHREKLDDTFDSPIFSNYNINSKLSFDIARNTILTLQGLLSNLSWREFDAQWELNPIGLAENKHFSHRLSASLTHTFSPKFFASARVASYRTKRLVLGQIDQEPPELSFQDPGDPRSRIINGNQPWEEETRENIELLKVDLVGQIAANHLIKAGMDLQRHNLNSKNTQFTAVPLKPSRNAASSIAYSRIENDFEYTPHFLAFYVQDKLDFGAVTANLGLRYDVFSPEIKIEKLPQSFRLAQQRLAAPAPDRESETQRPISPRIGISLPLSSSERVHFNYGWYYQMPPLYYLYTNSSYRLDSYLPIIGNADLSPIKTVSTELSYKREVSDDFLFVISGFTKKFKNIIDTQTFVFDEVDDNQIGGYAQYLNSASGRAAGVEVTLQKNFSPALSTRLSYTYMRARGSGSTAEEGFNREIFDQQLNFDEGEFPLSWDQRHSFILDSSYRAKHVTLNALYRLFSPLPVTTAGSSTPNDTRLSWRNIVDLKILFHTNQFIHGHVIPFLEIRNLLDDGNLIDQPDRSGVRAYRLLNPMTSDHGRRLRLGLSMSF